MIYSTHAANSILSKSFHDDHLISSMKLQRLTYIAVSEFLKRGGDKPLEHFQVWSYGPVLPSIYHQFSSWQGDCIDRYAKDAEGKNYVVREDLWDECVDVVWESFKGLSAVQLCAVLRMKGSAWDDAFQRDDDYLTWDAVRGDSSYSFLLLGS